MGRVQGKIAVVTSGALGMGKAFSLLLAREGATVVIADIDPEHGQAAVAEITAAGGKAMFQRLDVADAGAWAGLAAEVDKLGRLDILVNNAGIYVPGTVETTSPEDWDKIFAVNTKGVYLGARAMIPLMRKSGGGSIINISSNWGIVGFPDAVAYCATKGAVRLMSKAIAIDVAKDNIRVK